MGGHDRRVLWSVERARKCPSVSRVAESAPDAVRSRRLVLCERKRQQQMIRRRRRRDRIDVYVNLEYRCPRSSPRDRSSTR